MTHLTNSWADAHKSWMLRCFPHWDFSWINKYLSTKTICFSHFIFVMSTFAPIKISYSNTVCNKSGAEVWICLVSFSDGEWWSEILHCHMYFNQNDHVLNWNINVTVFSVFFSLDQNLIKPRKRSYISNISNYFR